MTELEHKGVIVDFQVTEDYQKNTKRIEVLFSLKGTHYTNAEMIATDATEGEMAIVYDRLEDWAKTVINENK